MLEYDGGGLRFMLKIKKLNRSHKHINDKYHHVKGSYLFRIVLIKHALRCVLSNFCFGPIYFCGTYPVCHYETLWHLVCSLDTWPIWSGFASVLPKENFDGVLNHHSLLTFYYVIPVNSLFFFLWVKFQVFLWNRIKYSL